MSVVGALLRKELRIEIRTLESVPGMALFARKPVHSYSPVPGSGNRGSVRAGRSGRRPAWK